MNTQECTPLREQPAAGRSVIEVRLREVRQLFDALDPSPFREKDIDPKAEEYIVESVKELPPHGAFTLVIHLDQSTGLPDEEQAIGDAVRVHFARRAALLRRDLHRLLRRGLISLAIGITFLAAILGGIELIGQLLGESAVALLSREGLIILGWVAMWRPLEIFLYDWWPVLGEQRVYERLSRVRVQIVAGSPQGRDELARILMGAKSEPLTSKAPTQPAEG